MIDIIIVSNGSKNKYRQLTRNAISSAIAMTGRCKVFVCDVKPWSYNANMVYPEGEFNYNRFLNEGAKCGDSEYIGFFNNDVLFRSGWFKRITDAMYNYKLDSASPFCPNTHPADFGIQKNSGTIVGNEVRKHLAGWAFVVTREFYNKIGGLDEGYQFWCSDNIYQKQLIAAGGKHALVTSSEVVHLGSQTLRDLSGAKKEEYTMGDVKKWNRENNENKFGWGT